MVSKPCAFVAVAVVTLTTVAACSGGGSASSGTTETPPTNPQDGPPAGYPDGHGVIPAEAQAEDVSSPTTIIGTGTPASCTGDAFVQAVANGGIITFDCGPDPVTIVLTTTAEATSTPSCAS